MDPITMGLISMGVGGGIKALGGLFDDSAQKRAAVMRSEAEQMKSSLEENMRRMEGSQTQVLSSTKVRMASTGFDSGSSSFESYLNGMAEQFGAQDANTEKRGADAYQAQIQAADLVGDNSFAKMMNFGSNLFGTAGNIFGTGKVGL